MSVSASVAVPVVELPLVMVAGSKPERLGSLSSEKIGVSYIDEGFRGVFALEDIETGEILSTIAGEEFTKPDRYTIQIGRDLHVNCGPDNAISYLNHYCDPNAVMDIENRCVRAARFIQKGEQIGFNYLTTEFKMDEPFNCRCGSTHCLRDHIQGFFYLTPLQRRDLCKRLAVSPVLRDWAKEADAGGAVEG
eukprot:ANDGO_00732.mRNA.1 hypothetical protein CAOG_00526